MSKNPFNSPEFKALSAEWDEKLEQSKFVDVEQTVGRHRLLKLWHASRFNQSWARRRFVEIDGYYDWAKSLLRAFPFKNHTHRKIWELHCDGKSKREIAKAISDLSPCYRKSQVGNIINLIRQEKRCE